MRRRTVRAAPRSIDRIPDVRPTCDLAGCGIRGLPSDCRDRRFDKLHCWRITHDSKPHARSQACWMPSPARRLETRQLLTLYSGKGCPERQANPRKLVNHCGPTVYRISLGWVQACSETPNSGAAACVLPSAPPLEPPSATPNSLTFQYAREMCC